MSAPDHYDSFLTVKTARTLVELDQWADRVGDSVSRGREVVESDEERIAALLYRLGGVGERAVRLRKDGVERHSEYGEPPWKWHEMAGSRNQLAHYESIDLDVVWHDASVRVPLVSDYLRPLLDEAFEYVERHGLEIPSFVSRRTGGGVFPSPSSGARVSLGSPEEPRAAYLACSHPVGRPPLPCRLAPNHRGSHRGR